jgi:mannose-6-phosphate isomerase-like protein (cupin superfamily)
MSLPPIHRVVTGHDRDGKAIVASNGPLSTIRALESIPGMIFHEVWETRGAPAPVDNCPDPTGGPLSHQAPKNGALMRFVDFPPDSSYLAQADARMKDLFKEVNDVTALTVTPDSPHPMMHRSEALDYGIVIEGEMTLVLDDSEVLLKPGSVVVQRGTNHAWANRTGKVCRMLYVQINGQYEPSIAAALARR